MTTDDVGGLLRAHLPEPAPAPDRVAAILDAIDRQPAEAQPNPTSQQKSFQGHPRRLTMVTAIVLIVLGIGTTVTTVGYSWSVSPLNRIVQQFDGDGRTPDGTSNLTPTAPLAPQPPLLDSSTLAFEPVILGDLPGGFSLFNQLTDGNSRLELHYVNNDGLQLDLVESPVGAHTTGVALDRYRLHVVGGVDVLMLHEEYFESVGHLIWEHQGIVFDLLVSQSTASRNLSLDNAEAIVTAMTTLDAP